MNTTIPSFNVTASGVLSSRVTLTVIVMLIIGEALAPLLLSKHITVYSLYHLMQTLLLVALAFVIKKEMQQSHALHASLSRQDWARVASLLAGGIIFSFAGDLINSGLFELADLLQPQTLLSIPPFALAHVCYIAAFYLLSRRWLRASSNLFLSITIAAAPVLAISVWSFVMPSDMPRFVAYATLMYAFIIATMVLAAIWVARAWRRPALPVMLGAFLFLVSDALLGYALLRERPFVVGQIIWATYILGQLLIVRAGLLFRAAPA